MYCDTSRRRRRRHQKRSGELQNLWYHMDRNKITRDGFRRLLLEETDSLPVTFPASPCPYPSGAVGPASEELSYAGDSTPKGGVSVTGARLQRVLNRAAYEDNLRRSAAGSAMTRALRGGGEGGAATGEEQEGERMKEWRTIKLGCILGRGGHDEWAGIHEVGE